jgi:hypothetical protein
MAKRRKKKARAHHRRRKATAHRSRARHFFGGGQHRPRMTVSGTTFHMRPKSPYKSKMRRVNRRHNPMLAEYLLGNPRHSRRRRHHNPASGLGMRDLTNPMPLLTDAVSGLAGVTAPVIVGNLITGYISPMAPMLQQPGIVGSAIRAAVRLGAAMGLDMVVSRVPMIDRTSYRVGVAIGIGGSFIMDLLGRPLLVGPGDTGMSVGYLFGSFSSAAPAAAGAGAYFRRSLTGNTGAYFRRGMTGADGTGALVPMARVRGVGNITPIPKDLFSAY